MFFYAAIAAAVHSPSRASGGDIESQEVCLLQFMHRKDGFDGMDFRKESFDGALDDFKERSFDGALDDFEELLWTSESAIQVAFLPPLSTSAPESVHVHRRLSGPSRSFSLCGKEMQLLVNLKH